MWIYVSTEDNSDKSFPFPHSLNSQREQDLQNMSTIVK